MIDILYEDKQVIVVVKPSNMPSQKDFSRSLDLMTVVEEHIGIKPFLIHRLDRHVSGPIVFAKTVIAARGLNKQLTTKGFRKLYIATVIDNTKSSGSKVTLVDYIKKEKNIASVINPDEFETISQESKKKYKQATLNYMVLQEKESELGTQKLLMIQLVTGRFHQIRAQLANHNLPIVGDPKYGVKTNETIGLQSIVLGFKHPTTGKDLEFMVYHKDGPFKNFEVNNEEFIKYKKNF